MTIYCPECEQPLAGGDINSRSALAMCNDCDIVFDISRQLREERRDRPGQASVRERVALPHGFRVERRERAGAGAGGGDPFRGAGRTRTDVVIDWPALHRGHRVVGLLAAAWVAFVGFGVLRFGFSSMTVPHLALAVGFLGFAAVGRINRVQIAIEDDALEIRRGPLPVWRARRLPAGGIEQIYCKKYVSHRSGGKPVWAFEVIARMRGGDHIRLVRRLERRDQAVYVEQLLEECLLITDVPVPGELRRL